MPLSQRRVATSALAGLLAALLATGPAFARTPAQLVSRTVLAQARPKLAVVVVPVGAAAQEPAARVDYVARQAVERSGRFDLLALVDALDTENAKARESRAKEGAEATNAARNAYNELDTNKAIADADRAIKAYADTDLTVHLKDLSTAWVLKIASIVANGENKAAQVEIDRLLAIDPSAQFSSNFFPADELAYVEKVRKQLAAADESLEVKTTPPGAEIYVDGKFQGVSPVTVKGLAPGDHYVTAKAAGYALAQQKSRPGSAELTLRKAEAWPRYQALLDKVTRDPEGPLRDAAAREFGTWLGAEQVLLAIVEVPTGAKDARLTALRLDPKDGHNWAYAREPLPSGDALLQKADAAITSLLAKDDPRKGGPVTHFADPNKGAWKKTAGYVLLGTGAAVMVGGLFFGLQANGKHNEFRAMHQTNPQADATASTGRTYAVIADVSYLVGLAAAGAGGYLAFASGPKTGGDEKKKPETKAASTPAATTDPSKAKADEDARRKKAEEDRRKKAEEDRRRAEEEKRRKEEEEKRRKRSIDDDDLRDD